MIKIDHNNILIPPAIFEHLRFRLTDLVEVTAQSARNHWIKLASMDSSSFKNDYIQGIQEVKSTPEKVTISLVGEVPHMVEDGSPSVDLRDILLNPAVVAITKPGSRGMRQAKDGSLYRSIPFRHATPGTKGAVGQEMGKAYKNVVSDWKAMGKKIYQAARSVGSAPLPAGTAGAFPLKNITTKTPHKTDIYAGMRRIEGTQKGRGRYMTWRTISTRVQDGSWIRKAIVARHYARKVTEFASSLIDEAIKTLGDIK